MKEKGYLFFKVGEDKPSPYDTKIGEAIFAKTTPQAACNRERYAVIVTARELASFWTSSFVLIAWSKAPPFRAGDRHQICIYAGDNQLPMTDTLIAQLLLIRFNEDHLLEKANKTGIRVMPLAA